MTLRVFNVLGREKQDFTPLEAGRVSLYVCGPTVQDFAHLGHARTYTSFDIMVRYLRYRGYNVLYVQNITDVGHLLDSGEDRVLRKAQQLQARPMQIVETYTRSYFADMDALGIIRPDISPRASGHIPEQIKMTQVLIDKGHAYVVNGNVYFDVTTAPGYGKLSNRRLDDQEAGSREDARTEKRHPEDFALWKRAEPEHILRWDSPWSEGFPGWHVECSAMAKKYLGVTFDIHGGGVDNLFPHNECEVAQSECANDADFARYWLLGGSLNVADADGVPVKMSKSLGNFITIKDVLATHRPEVIRLFVMSAHYSSPITHSDQALHAAASGWERLYQTVRLTRQMLKDAPEAGAGDGFLARVEQVKTDFQAAMDDDFNAPKAVAILQDFTREVNILLNGEATVSQAVLQAIDAVYRELGGTVLGIIPEGETTGSSDSRREAGLIELLIDLRARARAQKNYAEGDRIRNELTKLGVTLEDRADGTVWRVK